MNSEMRRIQLLTALISLIAFSACLEPDYHDEWSYPDKPKTGIYKRNLKALSNPPELEYIEITSDSTYRYVYKNPLYNDTITGTYVYTKSNAGNNNFASIEFNGLHLPYKPSSSYISASFTALYGSVGNEFYIDPSPEHEEDLFVLR